MVEFPQSGHLNLSHLFWLRCVAIIGQALAMVVATSVLGCKLPLLAMSCVIILEIAFNAFTLVRMARPGHESNSELFGQLCVDLGALTALLMLSGGTINPFFSLYLPALAIGAAVLPWRLGSALTGVAVLGYVLLATFSLPLVLPHSHDMFDLYRTGNWINFLISVCLISWFVARMSRVLRRREAALADAQQRLLRDERVVALGAQAASIAHEMGSPLSTIALLAEELRESAVSDQQLAPYRGDFTLLEQQITLCKEALKRLQSRAASPNRRRLRPWLANFVEQWRLRHPQAGFQSRGEGSEGIVIDDTVAVGQILTILLDNAARASGDYVVFEVESTLSDFRGTGLSGRSVAGGASGNANFGDVIFRIIDKGPGIPQALRAQIGSTPVRSTQGGAGVGLYLAFVTAARLHGTIELSDAFDAPGTGTCATLTLPAKRAEAPDE
jgi:two-component system sensor histidine kinase RegB